MKLNSLTPAEGSVINNFRRGRGQGSGGGGTATQGHKGAQSRSGNKKKRGFEGGQMPLQRRVPKRGFKNINRIEYVVFNLGQIEKIQEKYALPEFSLENLYVNGLISRTAKVKVLATGELKAKLTFKVNAISDKAKLAVEAAGGSVEIVK